MKKPKKAPKRVYKRRVKACAKSPTLEQVVKAAHEAGATVTVSLVPKAQPAARPRLTVPSEKWPGNPWIRSIMADLDYDEKDVAKVFKDNPSSQFIITPYEIIERSEFLKPKPAPTPEAEQSTSNPS